MTTPTQREWRELTDRLLRTWAAEMAGETLDKETYKLAEDTIARSEAAEREIVTDEQLGTIMPNLARKLREYYLPFLNQAMHRHAINTPLRAAAFLAQISHESLELKFMEEIWGPTPAQKRYEGRADLGNTQPGDGKRYKGRGPIQLTGRSNYRKYSALLGVDLEANPDLAANPEFAFQIAALFWATHGLNELADEGTEDAFRRITLRINGGYSGLGDRQRYYETAKKVLGVSGNQIG